MSVAGFKPTTLGLWVSVLPLCFLCTKKVLQYTSPSIVHISWCCASFKEFGMVISYLVTSMDFYTLYLSNYRHINFDKHQP